MPENRVFYRDDVPSFLFPFESRFSEEWFLNSSETELIVGRLTLRKRVKLETFETFLNMGETIKIRDKNYSQMIYSMIYFNIRTRGILFHIID